MRASTSVFLMAACVGTSGVTAAVATFDSFTEGDLGLSFTDSGITFFDFDDRAGTGPATFSCERADGTLSGPGFSPLNALGFGSWVPGPGAALQQCGSFSFSTGAVQNFASLDLFEWLSPPGNVVSLEAYRSGAMVISTSVVMPGNGLLNSWHMSVAGPEFDTLRLVGSGPTDRGIFIGLVDNVTVTPTPAAILPLLALVAARRRR